MLSLHAARHRGRFPQRPSRIGLAVAGGGPIGGMYELGVLRALDEALDGLDLARLDGYVGVSSGAFLAAGLANGMSTEELVRSFIRGDSDELRFRPGAFMRPAFGEYARRLASLPRRGAEWARHLADPGGPFLTDLLAGLLPTGLFDSAPIEAFLRGVFTEGGRSNDFRQLGRVLLVLAVDLDTGEAVRFGGPGWDDVPISKAIQASAAMPGMYPPVAIRGRHFVDGALQRTMHASLLLDRGIDLLIGINPLVPYDARQADAGPRNAGSARSHLAEGGLPAVLSQTFRTLLQSRMKAGLARYASHYPDVDQLVFEPNARDGELFFANALTFGARRVICELAYRNTLDDLRMRRAELVPVLASHGITMRAGVIQERGRGLFDGIPPVRVARRATDATRRLKRALDDVDHLLARRR